MNPDSDKRNQTRAPGNLAKDDLPWVTVASDVLNGKYDNADRSTLKSIQIGLRTIDDETCEAALKELRQKLKRGSR